MRSSQHLSPRQIAEAIRLRNWTEGEAPPKYRRGINAISKLIDAEKQREPETKTKGTK
jgi:hypothetical protein